LQNLNLNIINSLNLVVRIFIFVKNLSTRGIHFSQREGSHCI
jgi:hypothetical protein